MNSNFPHYSSSTEAPPLSTDQQTNEYNFENNAGAASLYREMLPSIQQGEPKARWRRALTSVYGQGLSSLADSSSMSDDESQRTQGSTPGRGCVQHNYHDHANDPIYIESPASSSSLRSFGSVDSDESTRSAAVTRFPERLFEMLSKMDEDGTSHIVSWQPHGRCFVVHKPKDFVEKVMPK